MSVAEPTTSTVKGRAQDSVLLMWSVRIASFIVILGAWELYGRQPDTFAIAPVTEVFGAMVDGFSSGLFPRALAGTTITFALGYVIAAVLGVLGGLWIAVSRYARNVFEPLVHAAYATPISLLIPVLGIYAGLGLRGRVTLVVLWCMFEILVNTTTGVREVSPDLIETGRAFNASRRDLYWKVVLPAARPYIMLGLKLGVAKAMRGAITAELLLAAANFGRVLLTAQSTFDVPTLLAGIVLTIVLGVVLMGIASMIEKRSMAYRTT